MRNIFWYAFLILSWNTLNPDSWILFDTLYGFSFHPFPPLFSALIHESFPFVFWRTQCAHFSNRALFMRLSMASRLRWSRGKACCEIISRRETCTTLGREGGGSERRISKPRGISSSLRVAQRSASSFLRFYWRIHSVYARRGAE